MWAIGRTRLVKEFHTLRRLASTSIINESKASTVDAKDVELHTKLLSEWWNPKGPMKALHAFNLIRVPFIRDGIVEYDDTETTYSTLPLGGKIILDVGCGGGILSEPLARLGAKVVGIDASPELIQLAICHSTNNPKICFNLPQYLCTTMEDHAEYNEEVYDAVVASEIIEHVNNKELFLQSCVRVLKREGRIFFTTPNRTKLAQLGVIFLAENIFKIVPKGTHQIDKFTTPNELQFLLERNGCIQELTQGAYYNFITNRWSWSGFQAFAFAMQAVKTN